MLNKKQLYINGCSFTAGDYLPLQETWPILLSKKLNLELINDSVNGNSIDSIFTNTISKLIQFPSYENLLVVIGVTWEPRYSVPFGKLLFNISPADINREEPKITFGDKVSTDRRVSSPYTFSNEELKKLIDNIKKRPENLFKVLSAFTAFYSSSVKYDPFLIYNQYLNATVKMIALQSFFQSYNIDYIFADFSGVLERDYLPLDEEHNEKIFLENKIDRSKVINFNKDSFKFTYIDKKTSHPSFDGTKFITNKILEKINEY